jgi:hypothetical protein
MSRWIRFLIAIAIGAAAGMYYGWVLNPVEYVDTAPDSLRIDYKTDYILMVAEAYHVDPDLSLAVRRLALLGDRPPMDIVIGALISAVEYDYAEADLTLMQSFADDLNNWNPSLEIPNP